MVQARRKAADLGAAERRAEVQPPFRLAATLRGCAAPRRPAAFRRGWREAGRRVMMKRLHLEVVLRDAAAAAGLPTQPHAPRALEKAHVRLLQGPGRVWLRRQARRGRRVPQDDLEVEPLHHDAAARLAPAPPERGGSPRRRAAAERRRQAKRRLHLRAPLGGPEVRGLAARLHHGDGLERRRGPALALPPAGLGRLAAFPERHPSYSSWCCKMTGTGHRFHPLGQPRRAQSSRASAARLSASCGADSKRGTGDASPCLAPADRSRGGARSAAWRLVRVSSPEP